MPQIRPLADIVHFKYAPTYLLTYYCSVVLYYCELLCVYQLLMDVARHKNSAPLPLIKPFTGPKLPPDRYCLTAPNYRLKSQKKVFML